jgi:hypothetical protein
MRIIVVWLTVLGVVPWLLRKTVRGDFTPEQAAWILVGAIVVCASPKIVLKFALAFGGLALFALQVAHGDPNGFWAVFTHLLALAFVLLGICMMIVGPFTSKSKK